MPEGIGYRRKRGLTQGKAKKIASHGGFKRLGNGFDSPAQKGLIGLRAGGGTPTRLKTRKPKQRRRHG